ASLADALSVFPRLRNDARRLEQHAEMSNRSIHLHSVCGIDAPLFGAEAVQLLDPVLGVLTVPAHVPLARATIDAGRGIGLANDTHDEIALGEAHTRRRLEHFAQ